MVWDWFPLWSHFRSPFRCTNASVVASIATSECVGLLEVDIKINFVVNGHSLILVSSLPCTFRVPVFFFYFLPLKLLFNFDSSFMDFIVQQSQRRHNCVCVWLLYFRCWLVHWYRLVRAHTHSLPASRTNFQSSLIVPILALERTSETPVFAFVRVCP